MIIEDNGNDKVSEKETPVKAVIKEEEKKEEMVPKLQLN